MWAVGERRADKAWANLWSATVVAASFWWQRHRWTLIFAATAIAMGTVVGAASEAVVLLPAPQGSRPEFYVELLFATIAGVALLLLLMSRAKVGLPLLLAALAFLPSRTGMQLKIYDPIHVTVADLVTVLGFVILMLHTKVLRKERLQPLVIGLPLWIWSVVGVIGLIVSVARGVPWSNYVEDVKGFYLWILIAVLCVNVIRTWATLRMVLIVAIVSALPDVLFQFKDASTGNAAVQVTLANGVTFNRTAGGAGGLNQYAFYLMIVFFLSIGLGLASRHWVARLVFFACAAYFFAGIILTYTRGAWIATAMGLVVLGIAGGRRVLAGLLSSSVVAYYAIPVSVWDRLSFSDNSVQERFGYIRAAMAVIRANPLLGGGWGSDFYLFGDNLVPSFVRGDIPFWHDDYLIVATQVGLPGLAVFLWILGAVVWATLRSYLRTPAGPPRAYLLTMLAAFVAMCAQAFTEMFFWVPQIGPMIWLVIGLMCAAVNIVRNEAQGAVSPRDSRRHAGNTCDIATARYARLAP